MGGSSELALKMCLRITHACCCKFCVGLPATDMPVKSGELQSKLLRGGYIGDFFEEDYRAYQGDTRSLE